MFYGCTSLTQAPALPATTLADYCYQSMFYNCTSLIQAPALPATTLAYYCYGSMFYGCTSLTWAPALPATTLPNWCYKQMFQGCINIKLSSTKTEGYTQEYRIPMLETNGTGTSNDLDWMFYRTGGTFTGTPKINTTYYLSSDNMIVYNDNKVVTLNGYVGSMIDEVVGPLDKSVLLNNLKISLPSDKTWSSVTFGNNRFVAVASHSNIAAYSDDGITWTQTELPSSEQWSSVVFGNNRFIAVASNSNIAAYSDDGITWTQTELPSSEQWRSVAFGDNRFVTISRSTSAYSDDGINWYDNTDVLTYPDNTDIKDRIKNVLGIGQSISTKEVSSMIDVAIAAKMDSYTIKAVMDSVATPHTQYYLGNQTAVDIVLPDSANVGQIITVCWYNGDTAATLSITGTMLSFDYTPSANTRSEINALWDGTYWAVLGNEMAVPSEVTA